jgi:16S rRNA (cytidine1402-2'-O)-methyltransferase
VQEDLGAARRLLETDAAKAAPPKAGRLLLVPAPLDFGCEPQAPLQDVLPEATLRAAAGLQYWVCENARTTRAYLKRVDAIVPLTHSLQLQQLQELPRDVHKKGDHLVDFDARGLLAPALAGHDIGLVSEAGMPAIADPGASVVRAAHALGLAVVPLVGPISLMLVLAASGLNGQNFAFVGYLPQDPAGRARRIRELERLAVSGGQTQLFIETPYRNAAMLQTLSHTLAPTTRLAIGSALTLPQGRVVCRPAGQWREPGMFTDKNTPAVFAIGR